MAAAITSAGAVPAVGMCWGQWPSTMIFKQDVLAAGAAGGVATADDAVGGVAAVVSILPIQGGLYIAPRKDELVLGRQHIGLADIRNVPVNYRAVLAEGGGIVVGPGVMDDTHRGVVQGDVDDLKSAVAVQKQTRGIVACAAGEVETWPVAPTADAKGVRHAHVAAGGVAVGQP